MMPYVSKQQRSIHCDVVHRNSVVSGLKLQQLTAWNFFLVRAVLMRETGISEAEALKREAGYRTWMTNILLGKKNPPISKEVDSYWHSHIICTQDYARFCKAVMGRFIHHVPNVNVANEYCNNGCTSSKCDPAGACNDGSAACGSETEGY